MKLIIELFEEFDHKTLIKIIIRKLIVNFLKKTLSADF